MRSRSADGHSGAVIELNDGKPEVCRDILSDLPDWFGLPAATAAYAEAAASLTMLVLYEDEAAIGFVTLKVHSPVAVEIHAMGVKQRFHRKGKGRALIEAAVSKMRQGGMMFMTVKTVADSSPSVHYAKTRRFYEAMGFLPLEVFPGLWGATNPCLMLIKTLRSMSNGA